MKKLLGAFALSVAFFFAPIDGATKETTEHAKTKQSTEAKKRKKKNAEKRAEARKKAERAKARKDAKTRTKRVEKEPTRVEKSYTPKRATTSHVYTTDPVIGTWKGREIHLGPREGQYYINEENEKRYLTDEQKKEVNI